VCGDGVWRIERCPPSSNIHCSAIQKDSMKHCDAKIIVKEIFCGIPSPCYDGLWFDLKGFAPIRHKFWFYAYDLSPCVGGTRRKYCVNKPLVPSMWPVQVGTYLIQFEVIEFKV
jgi:hypothetical protein